MVRHMRALASLVLCAIALTATTPAPLGGEPPEVEYAGPVRFAVLDDHVRQRLAADWVRADTAAVPIERAYCLRWQKDVWAGEAAYRVTAIAAPDSVLEAGVDFIAFTCPTDADVATLHIHPPTTCIGGACWKGGPYAYQCLPSDQDYVALRWRRDAFAMVQCDRHAVVAYFPDGAPQGDPRGRFP